MSIILRVRVNMVKKTIMMNPVSIKLVYDQSISTCQLILVVFSIPSIDNPPVSVPDRNTRKYTLNPGDDLLGLEG